MNRIEECNQVLTLVLSVDDTVLMAHQHETQHQRKFKHTLAMHASMFGKLVYQPSESHEISMPTEIRGAWNPLELPLAITERTNKDANRRT